MAFERLKLSKTAVAEISKARRAGENLSISDISLWEVAAGVRRERIRIDISLESFLQEIQERFDVLPITGQASARGSELPATFPKDPADRIIVGTALVRGLTLITADAAIRRSGAVPTIW